MKKLRQLFGMVLAIYTLLCLAGCDNAERDFREAASQNTEHSYNAFIAKHQASPLVSKAQACMEVLAFAEAMKNETTSGWETFLGKHGQSTNIGVARQHLSKIVFQHALAIKTVSSFEEVIQRFPNTDAATNAATHVEMLDYQSAINADSITAYDEFLRKHPSSAHAKSVEVRRAIQTEEYDWKEASSASTAKAYMNYYGKHPDSSRIQVEKGMLKVRVTPPTSDGGGMVWVGGKGDPGIQLRTVKWIYSRSLEKAHDLGIITDSFMRDAPAKFAASTATGGGMKLKDGAEIAVSRGQELSFYYVEKQIENAIVLSLPDTNAGEQASERQWAVFAVVKDDLSPLSLSLESLR